MAVWPKFVYRFHLNLRTAALRRKLRDVRSAPAQQEAALQSLTCRLSATTFWKQHGIETGMSYARFQARVPIQTYEQIAPAVEQMKQGEKDVLWPGTCTLFGLTAGTARGTPKCLPMTAELLTHFHRAGGEALLHYTARARNTRVFKGRHLYYSAPLTLTRLTEKQTPTIVAGEVSGIAALNFPAWVERHLYEPGRAIARVSPPDAQMDAIITRTASRDITLIAGVPNSVPVLTAGLRNRFGGGKKSDLPLEERWPNLQCFMHTGASLAPLAAELRSAFGNRVEFHEVYAASEGIVAAQDIEPRRGLRVMADMGIFFEFVPLAEFDDLRLDQLGRKAVPLSGVKVGVDYLILLTTPGGLARYVLGDVVRFTSVTPPRLVYVGGTELRLNAFGENVMEENVSDALVALCQHRAWTLVNFHVAPLFAAGIMTGQRRGVHEWWVELKSGTVVTPTGPQMALELDATLRESCVGYALKRATGVMDAPIVRLVMPGVFEHWLRFHEKWAGQYKMPRCRSDRRVADEFAQMTNFARD